MTSIWDDPDMKVNDDFVKFDNVGDTVTGTIVTVRAHRFDDNSVAPQILLKLDDGTEKTLTAGQVRLKAALAEKRPEAGDRITVTLTEVEKRGGGKTLKHFELQVNPTSAAPAPVEKADPTPADAPKDEAKPDPAAIAAALSALTDEQKKTLGIA